MINFKLKLFVIVRGPKKFIQVKNFELDDAIDI